MGGSLQQRCQMSTFLIAELKMAMLCFARYLCIQPLLANSNMFMHLFHFGTCFFSKELQLPSLVNLHSLIHSLICPFAFEAMDGNVLQLLRLDGVFLFYILIKKNFNCSCCKFLQILQ